MTMRDDGPMFLAIVVQLRPRHAGIQIQKVDLPFAACTFGWRFCAFAVGVRVHLSLG